ncbi:pyridine nucleotide-disulfide oxidoreductase [Nocardiopsis kunsanensis]|uniref:Pyridine nucleotide-disulfide oxidoreductase n=1 Tax=Nocardiopsis kunsanensis TaxID=141693 RepID=A0A919CHI0_9ACTN|nr:FAD-dependent oxidoreductase [Nocardiopsis kunsanensis]GHD24848.1 pyridine nucleotide-disulfide oxidoreductase [Nocardiopsis kunsanensis]
MVIAGGSIAAATTAQALRAHGFEGGITLLSDEIHAPYSRVPLSKGVLSGKETLDSAALPELGEDVAVRLGARVTELRPKEQRLVLVGGEHVPYDGLVIATGARPRRLAAPDQTGEYVVRTLEDATRLKGRIGTAESVLVVGGGVLGMEVASTCNELGLAVTVVDRDPPLRRLLGAWLADRVVESAVERGVRFVRAPEGVRLVGSPEVTGVDCGDRRLNADVVVSAVGDIANTDWLAGSGLLHGADLVVDERCRVAPDIVAAGDVTVTRAEDGTVRRSPHWTSAVLQGQAAARSLLDGDAAPVPRADPYYWTEQFGLDIKMSGDIPADTEPTVLAGDPRRGSGLLQWQDRGRPVAAVSMNHRVPVAKLKKLGARASVTA